MASSSQGLLRPDTARLAAIEAPRRLRSSGVPVPFVMAVVDLDPAKAGGVDAARDKEGAAILAALPSRAHVILLAIEGKERSSEELSARLDDLMLRGSSDIAFVIGGSDGVSDEVRARADEMLSFGRITLPHNLARVVLLEQIYRACKISRGEPYHK